MRRSPADPSSALVTPKSRMATWLDADKRLSPARASYRLVRVDQVTGDIVVLEQAAERVSVEAFERACTLDQQGLTGWLSYKIIAIGPDGSAISQLPMRAKGAAASDAESGGVGIAALAGIVKESLTTTREDYRLLFEQQMRFAASGLEETERLRDHNAQLRNQLEELRVRYAVERASSTDPVRDAQGKLWERLGELASEAPQYIAALAGKLQGSAALPPSAASPETKQEEPDERVVELCVALSVLPFDVVARMVSLILARDGLVQDLSAQIPAERRQTIQESAIRFSQIS